MLKCKSGVETNFDSFSYLLFSQIDPRSKGKDIKRTQLCLTTHIARIHSTTSCSERCTPRQYTKYRPTIYADDIGWATTNKGKCEQIKLTKKRSEIS